ncbi:hypothetical protein EVAR_82376_1 [Eumeta japonica]|uniref:Uncharacterized protein n=1 Tax=Eumeta variegata TaxID=151549 RepID=A0A4C1UA10_EUMVA|nr:hypothetical protein EVAR_82376_1 [Eumeta japonica]
MQRSCLVKIYSPCLPFLAIGCCARQTDHSWWETQRAFSGPLSRSVTHRYVTERYIFHNILSRLRWDNVNEALNGENCSQRNAFPILSIWSYAAAGYRRRPLGGAGVRRSVGGAGAANAPPLLL